MTARQQRRLEERRTRKEARKTQNTPAAAPESASLDHAAVNRANAQHSTGPRTEGGKSDEAAVLSELKIQERCSSRNSFKHGLYSKQLVLPGEDPAELDALRDDLRREHQPGTPTEDILVNELAEHYWRLRRMRKFEARAMGAGTIEELHKGLATLPIIQRTMAAAERGFHKALTTLKQLQKERGTERRGRLVPGSPLGQVRDSNETPQIQEPETGFVSQKTVTFAPHEEESGFVPQNSPEPVTVTGEEQGTLYREAA